MSTPAKFLHTTEILRAKPFTEGLFEQTIKSGHPFIIIAAGGTIDSNPGPKPRFVVRDQPYSPPRAVRRAKASKRALSTTGSSK